MVEGVGLWTIFLFVYIHILAWNITHIFITLNLCIQPELYPSIIEVYIQMDYTTAPRAYLTKISKSMPQIKSWMFIPFPKHSFLFPSLWFITATLFIQCLLANTLLWSTFDPIGLDKIRLTILWNMFLIQQVITSVSSTFICHLDCWKASYLVFLFTLLSHQSIANTVNIRKYMIPTVFRSAFLPFLQIPFATLSH